MSRGNFAPFAAKMAQEGLPDIAIQTFSYYYEQLVEGQTGLIAESEIRPVTDLPDVEKFGGDYQAAGEASLSKAVVIKLNGGLGTSMGLSKAKSLLTVKNGLTFLDIIAQQALKQKTPLLLMNSFNTQEDTLESLKKYPDLWDEIPLDFVQHKIPKIVADDFAPAIWPANPELEWCPPGHGDIYTALITSGMLDTLLDHGYEVAFVSNSDNLGAVLDSSILGYFVTEKLPFMMEVADRTAADKKGGHLAQLPNGQLILRESAQCPDADEAAFQDTTRHKYFNTNNLWLNLPVLKQLLEKKEGILGLPMIRNRKTVDPRRSDSTPVFQLETAMGSAIAVFKGAGALRVPRTRFAPVKTTADLLGVRSDCYVLTDEYRVVANPQRQLGQVVIDLDSSYFKLIDQLESRFPFGAPSLIECRSFAVQGDVSFGRNVVVQGQAMVSNNGSGQLKIEDGAVLT
ncbi:MAG: UTP--glucose-1-phosphate uridylyltransferase [Ardenticatenaceae bacterium]|nr:UTP--glucose-1-phosphate uridylyltransferase [Ardenticatenaceae bacterium]